MEQHQQQYHRLQAWESALSLWQVLLGKQLEPSTILDVASREPLGGSWSSTPQAAVVLAFRFHLDHGHFYGFLWLCLPVRPISQHCLHPQWRRKVRVHQH